jgi:hypothetical protein
MRAVQLAACKPHAGYKIFIIGDVKTVITQFQLTIAKNCWAFTLYINISYVVCHERVSSRLNVSCVFCEYCCCFDADMQSVVSFYDWMWLTLLEDFFPFQNMHVENVRIDHSSKMCPSGFFYWNGRRIYFLSIKLNYYYMCGISITYVLFAYILMQYP